MFVGNEWEKVGMALRSTSYGEHWSPELHCSIDVNLYIHNRHVPSPPALTHQASLGCQSRSRTPSPLLSLCPRSTFNGTMVALAIISPTTFPWNTCNVPSSETSANNGCVGWNLTARIAFPWYRSVLYGFDGSRSRSCQSRRRSYVPTIRLSPMLSDEDMG